MCRIVLNVRDPHLGWPEHAEKVATDGKEYRAAKGIKSLWLVDNGRPDSAIALIDPYLPDAWALEARYYVAVKTDAADAAEWAAEALATNPDQPLRLQCAETLLASDSIRARAEFAAVAGDERAQPWVRTEAYGQLVTVLLNERGPKQRCVRSMPGST